MFSPKTYLQAALIDASHGLGVSNSLSFIATPHVVNSECILSPHHALTMGSVVLDGAMLAGASWNPVSCTIETPSNHMKLAPLLLLTLIRDRRRFLDSNGGPSKFVCPLYARGEDLSTIVLGHFASRLQQRRLQHRVALVC